MFTDRLDSDSSGGLSRRQFFGGLAGLGASTWALGSELPSNAPRPDASAVARSRTRDLLPHETRILRATLPPILRLSRETRHGSDAPPFLRGLTRDRLPQMHGRPTDARISTSASGFNCLLIAAQTCADILPNPRKSDTDAEHRLSRQEAVDTLKQAAHTGLASPHRHGIGLHFIGGAGPQSEFSTIDWLWLVTGLQVGSVLLGGPAELEDPIAELASRVVWPQLTHPERKGLLRHGLDSDGVPLNWVYEKGNCETLMLYLHAIGASRNGLPAEVIKNLDPCWHEIEGLKIASGHLGLFVLQWALEFVPAEQLSAVLGCNLLAELSKRVQADIRRRDRLADQCPTYKEGLWGISPGDDPSGYPANGTMCEGTVNIMAALACVRACPDEVMELLARLSQKHWARAFEGLRYGLPNTIKVGHPWALHDVQGVGPTFLGPDAVSIDYFTAAIALINALCDDMVRKACCKVECMARGLSSLRRLAHA